MRSAAELLEELNAVDESIRIEAKRASEIGKSVLQTVIAYTNEPNLGGGYLLLGADWKTDDKGDVLYWAAGILDPDKIQRDLACQCASMLSVVVRPEMRVESVDGKALLAVFVPEAAISQKPVYLQLQACRVAPTGESAPLTSVVSMKTSGFCAVRSNRKADLTWQWCMTPVATTLIPRR
jgi:predicted HTH transcriptional regulator